MSNPFPSLAALPVEFLESIEQTFFLHRLVTDPENVIPPGKSLLSMMTHTGFKLPEDESKSDHTALEERVKEVAHHAFWTEAVESLSSPLPSIQLLRLQGLYLDLSEALTPLFPRGHRILVAFSFPPAPTSSPLHSTLNFIREILAALRERCAPVRDAQIDGLISSISLPPPPHTTLLPNQSSSTPGTTNVQISALAEFVITNIKSILSLADEMKADLNNFVLGSMTEGQLLGVLSSDVKKRERDLVLKLWGGKDVIRSLWRTWLKDATRGDPASTGSHRWRSRLGNVLESDKQAHCIPPSRLSLNPSAGDNVTLSSTPSSDTNFLPPQLFFSAPAIVHVQNSIQAIVIAAALRLLTRLPTATSAQGKASPSEPDFLHRVWALLKAEVDSESDTADTKIINLADEVIRAKQLTIPPPGHLEPDEEKRLRDTVERTLRSTDPVFLLLRKRLVDALEKWLISDVDGTQLAIQVPGSSIPARMQTGKDLLADRSGKRPRLMLPEVPSAPSTSSILQPQVLGFEDDLLRRAISEAYQKLAACVAWTEGVWGDLV